MMNSIKSRNKKFTFILYEGEQVPRYFNMSKNLFRFLFYGLPAWSFITLIFLTVASVYFNEIRNHVKRSEPTSIRNLKETVATYLKEKNELTTENQELLKKISESAIQGEFPTLSLYKRPYGQKDLTNPPNFEIEDIQFIPNNETMVFKFNIVNITQSNEKRAGYIHLLVKTKDALYFYPQKSINEFLISFDQGEPFATSRFRPVEAIFPMPPEGEQFLAKILIFSRSGDLLHKKMTSSTIKN